MKSTVLTVSLFLLVLGAGSSSAAGRAASFDVRLQRAVEAGQLTAGRADLYRLYRLRNPSALPAALRPAAQTAARSAGANGEGVSPRSGTVRLRILRERLAQASPAIQALAQPYLDTESLRTVGRMSRAAGRVIEHVLPNAVVTEHFSVEWGSGLTNENGTTPVLDQAPSFLGDPAVGGNGVPDVVERWAAYLEASYGRIVEELGFTHPVLDDYLVPVYMGNSAQGTAIDDINVEEVFGFTTIDDRAVPYMVLNNDLFHLLGVTRVRDIQDFMQVTAAHEFFHVIHFLYESEATRTSLAAFAADSWWWEASSTWMEDEVFDSIDDYQSWLTGPDGWSNFVEAGLAPNLDDFHYDPRAYGAVVLAKYFSEHVSGRGSMRDVWVRIRPSAAHRDGQRVLDALGEYAAAQGFDDLGHLFLGFAAANAVMDYEEGADYGEVTPRAESLNVDSRAVADDLPVPGNLAATYLERPAGAVTGLHVAVSGVPDALDWGLALNVQRSEGYGVALAARSAVGLPEVAVAGLSGDDELFASPSFLHPGADSLRYTGTEGETDVVDRTSPEPVALVRAPSVVPGGFDLLWQPAVDPGPEATGVAGYVVRWGATARESRTLFGPVTGVEVRGLEPGTYDLQVFAYDVVGNAALPAESVQVTVAEGESDAPVPRSGESIPNSLIVELVGGGIGGGGGGEGGGCFLSTMMR